MAVLGLLAAPQARAAVSAKDDLGNVVTLARPARRVVALAPHAVEILYDVGAGGNLVGVVSDADYPPDARKRPRTGSYSNPDEEAIVAQKPDLVVVSFGNPKALLERLKARGLPYFVSHPRTVADVMGGMRSLGRLTGHAGEGVKAAGRFRKRLDALAARLKGRRPVRAALLVWDDPITLAGAGAFLHDVLRLAGGANVAADLPQPYPTLDPEQFAVRNPEAIVFALHDQARVKGAATRPGIRNTAAARNHRIFSVPEDLTIRPGPRLISGIEQVARGLHPEAFR